LTRDEALAEIKAANNEERRVDLIKADLSGIDLIGANLIEADLDGANLSKANLNRADLSGSYMGEANLREANLYGATIYEADMCRADLYKADLREANLIGTDLIKANLREANLREADLGKAALDFCEGIISITGEDYTLYLVQFPDGPKVKAGCRWFESVAEAKAHCEKYHNDHQRHKEIMLAKLDAALLLAKAQGWEGCG